MDNLIGQKLDGRYQIEQLIGEGGMADVYRGTDLLENRQVAVKVLKDEFRGNEELVRRFKNESRAISVLNHPSIVKVFDVSVGDRLQYIVMEYIDGITLKEYIEQRGEPLTYKEAVHFTGLVLQALQHAHAKGIVHRDVKPQNIMILEDGSIRVMDFGIARLARSEIHTAGEQAVGSVHYISPEQAQGADTDPRADIYSLGIIMYEMLSGRLPFEDENAVSVAIKQISDQAVPLRQVNPSVPQGLADITMKAMAKDPGRRYQDALDMLRDIEEFKRDPSIKFEYDYLGDSATKVVGKVMADNKTPKNGRPAGGSAVQKGGKRRRPIRKKKIGLLVPIVLGLTIVVVGICLVYATDVIKNSSNPLFGEYEDVELPDFVGGSYEDLLKQTQTDTYKYLRLKVTEVYNPEYAAGTIISQNPTSSKSNPKKVKANQQLSLVVSRGIENVEVPDVSGMSRNEATQAILEKGLMPYARAEYGSTVPAGKVIRTQPEAGITVQNVPGTVITIFVSSERSKYETTVPDVTGLSSLAAAQSALEIAGLMVGQVIEVDSEEPEGTILSQLPEKGTVVTIATSVRLTVAKGPPPVVDEGPVESEKKQVPGVVGSSLDRAIAALASAGFNGEKVSEVESDEPKGTVVKQSPEGGTMAKVGARVKLTVSKGPATSSKDPSPSSSKAPPPSSSAPPPSSSAPPPSSSSEAPPPASSSSEAPPPASSSSEAPPPASSSSSETPASSESTSEISQSEDDSSEAEPGEDPDPPTP